MNLYYISFQLIQHKLVSNITQISIDVIELFFNYGQMHKEQKEIKNKIETYATENSFA